MFKIRLAAAALCFALVPTAASAQTSYESRGYGGPLGIGPNFQQGGQHAPPVYGSVRNAPTASRAIARRSTSTAFSASATPTTTM